MSEAGPVVECRAVHKRFGAVEALRGVDLCVAPGELVALIGSSGSGKSTLLHLLAALDTPTSGRILVHGHDPATLRAVNRYRRLEVGIVFQLHNLLPHLSARANVEIAMFGTGRSVDERSTRATYLLDELELSHVADRTPTRLSGGERQRVAIARAIANEPVVLLADEPTGSLDPCATARVLDAIERLRVERGMTVVMATHDPAATERADRVVRIEAGSIVAG